MLDEPVAALSPSGQLTFLARLDELVGLGSQLVIATHSPILMAYPAARILELSQNGIREVLTKTPSIQGDPRFPVAARAHAPGVVAGDADGSEVR